ncbi:MAG: OOP family OmpA-OmpF porin [Urechidicola sp.]|jgi:OOP family OmpA-OmpF porin
MSVNLLDLFKDQLSGAAMNGISTMLGESKSITGSALGGIAATLLGSLAGKASTSDGAADLLGDLGKADTEILDNVMDLMGGGDSTNSLLDTGGSLVSNLLGGNSNSVIDSITAMTGIGKESSGTLLKMAAPLLMGFVGKYVKNKALDAVGLGKLMGSQKDHIKSAMPSGLFDSLGFSSIGDAAKDVVTEAAGAVSDVTDDDTSGGGFMKPLIVALALLALVFFGYKSCSSGEHSHGDQGDHGHHTEEVEKAVDDAMSELEDDHLGLEKSVPDHGEDIEAMDTKGLGFVKGSWAYSLSGFLAHGNGSKTFTLDKIPFDGKDDDEISAEGTAQLENLAKILNAYPNVNAEIQGHTAVAKNAIGRTGKKAASKARALWVQLKLKAMGVAGSKLSSKGYADENLISSIAEDAEEQKRIVVKFDK